LQAVNFVSKTWRSYWQYGQKRLQGVCSAALGKKDLESQIIFATIGSIAKQCNSPWARGPDYCRTSATTSTSETIWHVSEVYF